MYFGLIMTTLLSVASCKKDSTPACTTTDSTQTFTAKIKPILDATCVTSGCHDAASAPLSNGVDLSNYDGAVAAAKNKDMVGLLQTGVMPKGGPVLPDSLINKIIAWRNNCYQR